MLFSMGILTLMPRPWRHLLQKLLFIINQKTEIHGRFMVVMAGMSAMLQNITAVSLV